jgi:ABC-type Mn2+/Zn2+ transport system permease subunit
MGPPSFGAKARPWFLGCDSDAFGGQKVDTAELDALEAGKMLCRFVDFTYLPAVIFAAFSYAFSKELKVLLFSRTIGAATGVHETFVYSLFLGLCGTILAVNLPLVGGLMISSLITNPAAAAYPVCRGHRAVVVASTGFGVLSAVGGFVCSYYPNLPTGACTVLVSTMLFALAAGYRTFGVGRD